MRPTYADPGRAASPARAIAVPRPRDAEITIARYRRSPPRATTKAPPAPTVPSVPSPSPQELSMFRPIAIAIALAAGLATSTSLALAAGAPGARDQQLVLRPQAFH